MVTMNVFRGQFFVKLAKFFRVCFFVVGCDVLVRNFAPSVVLCA